MSIPKPKCDELIDKFNAIADEPVFDELALLRYKHDVGNLKNIPSEVRLSLFGMIACLEKEYGEMRKFHEQALAVSPNDPWVLTQYASSLGRTDYYEEAYKYAFSAWEKEPDNAYLLEVMIDYTEILGFEDKRQFYLKKLKSIQEKDFSSEKNLFPEDVQELREQMLDCLEKDFDQKDKFVRISDSDFTEMLDLAKEIEALS